MSKVKRFFIAIYNKVIGDDIDTVKYMLKQRREGKPILDPEKKRIALAELKKVPKALFTESWYWVLAIIFVFCMGYLVGLKKCEVACNNFVTENYINPELTKVSPSVPIFPSYIGNEDGEQENNTKDTIPDIIR